MLTDSHSNFGLIVTALTTLLPYVTQFVAYGIQAQVMLADLITAGIRWISNLDNVRGVAETVGAKVREVFDAISAKVTSAVASVVAAGDRVGLFRDKVVGYMIDLGVQFVSRVAALVTTATELPGRLVSAVGDLGSRFVAVGRGIIDGIIEGITGGVGRIASSARQAAQSALDAAKGLLGINSPSRVFRIEVGRQIAAGMALGINDGRSGIRSEMDAGASIRPTASRLPTASVHGSALPPAPRSGVGAAGVTINGNVGWDPERVAREVHRRQQDAYVVAGLSEAS